MAVALTPRPSMLIAKATPMERFSWFVLGVIALASGRLLTSTAESSQGKALGWLNVLLGVKLLILTAAGRYPVPRSLRFLKPDLGWS